MIRILKLLGALHEGLTLVSPHPETSKAETTKDSLEQEGQPVLAPQWKWPWFPMAFSARDPRSFCHCRNQMPAQSFWTLKVSLLMFSPISFMFIGASCLNTSPIPPTTPIPHWSPGFTQTGNPGLCSCTMRHKSRPSQLTATAVCTLWANLSSYEPALYCPDSHPRPQLPCVYPWRDPATMVVLTKSQIQSCLLSQT